MGNQSRCVVGAVVVPEPFDPEILRQFDAPESREIPNWEIALKVFFYVLAFLMDVIGNSIVILIISRNRKMRNTTNVLILNLAVSDLMVATFCMWVHMGNQVTDNWPFGPFLCKFSTFSQVMAVTASVLTLTVISVERLIAIVFPFRRHWSPTVTGLIIGSAWLVAIGTASPHLFVRTQLVYSWRDKDSIFCVEDWPRVFKDTTCRVWEPDKIIFYLIEGIVMYFIPILVMIVAYTIISIKMIFRKAPGSLISTTTTVQEKAKRKVIKMLLIVLTVFIICWTPQQTMLLWEVFRDEDKVDDDYIHVIKYVAVYIAYFNSALNPIIYAGFNENFRKGFLEAFKCLLIHKSNKIGPESTLGISKQKQSSIGTCVHTKGVDNHPGEDHHKSRQQVSEQLESPRCCPIERH